jgi:hypothetical protein
VEDLDSAAKYELNPDVPSPCKELFDEATDDWAED